MDSFWKLQVYADPEAARLTDASTNIYRKSTPITNCLGDSLETVAIWSARNSFVVTCAWRSGRCKGKRSRHSIRLLRTLRVR